MQLGLHLPINSVSFGQLSTLILRTIYEREKTTGEQHDLFLFPIGQPDLSSQNVTQEFQAWLQSKISRAFESWQREIPLFKLWHLNGSLESYSAKQTLLTFYELDNPTRVEMNVARNSKTCFSSKYSCDVFKMFGVDTTLLPLAFDSYNFGMTNKTYHEDGRIVFNLCGKLEKRKHHAKVIQSWVKKFGNNRNYFLQCATFNPFLGGNPQECERNNNAMVAQILGQSKPFNVQFYPMMRENNLYNDFLNSADIILGMSGGEGWGLPEFHSVAMGKHAVLLNAHSYKTWATPDMVTFVTPNGKVSSVDNMFFKQGEAFNQGQIFDWNPDDFVAACEKAVERVKQDRLNRQGLVLQQRYTKEAFVDNILKLTTS